MDFGPPPRYTPSSSKRSAWKRPKPKVYECNERDAMRFYETSYNEYKRNKEDAEDRRRTEANRDILTSHPLSWRASSQSRERPRPSREQEERTRDPFKREGSMSGFNTGESSSDGRTRLNNQSATEIDDSFQNRLDKLKKLREELGLPQQGQENGTAESYSSSLRKSAVRETTESGNKSSISSESRFGSTKKSALAVEEDDDIPSYRSRRAKATPSKDEDEPKENKWSKFSSYKEKRQEDPEPDVVDPEEYTYKAKSRSDGWRSKLADDLSKCDLYENIDKERKTSPFSIRKNDYSFKSSANGDVNGDSSFSSRSAYKSDRSSDIGGASKSFSSASASSSSYKSKAVDMSDDFDMDDSIIASLGKKLPSSAEILERISKMQLDD